MTKARQLADLGNAYDDGAITGSNMIINGAMVFDQRNSASAISSLGQYTTYTLDRWQYYSDQGGKFSFQQNQSSVTPPVGFTKYLGLTSLSAYSLGTNETASISQHVEGFNCAQLNWGTSNAKTVSLSFWVRSSLTGTFSGVLAGGQNYIYTYDITSANTWEYKTITIQGSTTGTWNTGNTSGVRVLFTLGYGSGQVGTANAWQSADFAAAGSVQVIGTNGATFQITGVQLEVGDTATPFEHRSYGEELAKCERYYERLSETNTTETLIGLGVMWGSNRCLINLKFNTEKRTNPTVSFSSSTSNHVEILNNSGWRGGTSLSATAHQKGARIDIQGISGATGDQTSGIAAEARLNPGIVNPYIEFDAEL